jgi:hypothetical protein
VVINLNDFLNYLLLVRSYKFIMDFIIKILQETEYRIELLTIFKLFINE